jgi:uncharacterized spore protein YtfJ
MEQIKQLVDSMVQRFRALAQGNAVVAKAITVGDRHVVPLCELGIGFGGGGGSGESGEGDSSGTGTGAGAGGGVKASPIAVLVIEGNQVRLEKIGN